MPKTVIIGYDQLSALKEADGKPAVGSSLLHDAAADDEYTIGAEKNSPAGGVYYHVNEGLLKEGFSKLLYHFTGIEAAFKICRDDVIHFQSAYAKDSDNYDKKRKFYLSCARQPNVKMGFASKMSKGGVRICLDGDKLSQKFAGKPVDYWAGDVFQNKQRYYTQLTKDEAELMDMNKYEISKLKKKNPNITDDEIKKYLVKHYNPGVQQHLDNEMEDRILSYEPSLQDAHKYIISVDVFLPNVLEDQKKMSYAAAFLYNTAIGRNGKYVRIFDSLEQFSNPHGKPVNDQIGYESSQSVDIRNRKDDLDELIGVIGFITYGEDKYDGKKFGPAVAVLLKQYGLEKYVKNIGNIKFKFGWYSFQIAAEKLDSVRRSLSDEPSEDKSKMLKMLTDYCLSIGADSFREAYLIKKRRETDKYNQVYDRIDTNVKLPYVIVRGYTISLHPDKDKFIDAIGWTEDNCKGHADMLASEAFYGEEGKYNRSGSKNYQSMFTYIYKLLRKGTVSQVMNGLHKLGFDDGFLKDWGVGISVENLDYWNALDKETVESRIAQRNNEEYQVVRDIRKKGIEEYVASHTMKESVNEKHLLKETVESIENVDLSTVGSVQYGAEFDEDAYEEWLVDDAEPDTYQNKWRYFTSSVDFELELFDNETYHHMCFSYADYNDLKDVFGEKMADRIVKDCIEDGGGSFETRELYDDEELDINDPNAVSAYAKKIFQHGPYDKDWRGYILPDGEMIYTELEHNAVTSIPGVNDKLQFVRMGNIRVLSKSINIGPEPTQAQYDVLRQIAATYADDELYLDIFTPNGEIGAMYVKASPNYVIGEIKRYFSEGIRPQGSQAYEEEKPSIVMAENVESEIEAKDVDLSSFDVKSELDPSIWKGDVLDSRIRMKLLDIADDFWNYVGVDWVEPEGIFLTGSICGFNYSDSSDIDLHISVDFSQIDDRREFVRRYMDEKKGSWNASHKNLEMMGRQVELYVEDVNDNTVSAGMYDLEKNEWVNKPAEGKQLSSEDDVREKAANLMTIIDGMADVMSNVNDSHVLSQLHDDAKMMFKKLKAMRQDSLSSEGEQGTGNSVYKLLRREGYLEQLSDILNASYDKVNSINEEKKLIKEYLDKDYNIPLYKYFKWASSASEEDKALDLCYHCPWGLKKYVSMYGDDEMNEIIAGDDDVYDDERIEQFVRYLSENKLIDKFISTMSNDIVYYGDLPAWVTMDYIRPVKNEWCIHFTSDANNISREGFTGGTDEIENLAYTNAGHEKPGKGYNFAYLIGDRNVDEAKYGNEAVIFRASGVLVYHDGDEEYQVIFWGPNVKEFIPIVWDREENDWVVYGRNGQILNSGKPSEIADWATYNLPQYRKQIQTGKSGYIPKMYDISQHKYVDVPFYRNESIERYLKLLKEKINEEVVADGNAAHNPYSKRWKAEREALKNFLCNFGKLMTSKENGKQYKVYLDQSLSNLIGYNYCICVQWDPIELIPNGIPYVRAYDKFSERIFRPEYDYRGFDNVQGTADDIVPESVKPKEILKEYLEGNGVDLYNYLRDWEEADVDDKVKDIYDKAPWAFREYFEKFNVPVDYDDENEVFEWFEVHTNRYEHFLRVVTDFCDWVDLPLWFHVKLTDNPLVKNEWLIHFSDSSDAVSKEGFKYGCWNMEKLGLTRWLDTDDLNGVGYNFAYRLDEKNMNEHMKYGEDAVIFRASGVEVHHYNDNENQVIFYGPTAKDFVYLRRSDGRPRKLEIHDLKTGRTLASFETNEQIIEWFKNNNLQYRKRIFN